MVSGPAEKKWNVALGNETSRTWETYKKTMSKYISKEVIGGTGVYDRQKTYLLRRSKPKRLSPEEWYHRIEQISLYLPYLFETKDEFNEEYPGEDFKAWWTKGALTENEIRRILIFMAPASWQAARDLADVEDKYYTTSPANLVRYYEKIAAKEKNTKKSGTDNNKKNNDRNGQYKSSKRNDRPVRYDRNDRNDQRRNYPRTQKLHTS